MSQPLSAKQRYQKRLGNLRLDRESWLSHWRELSDYIQPRRGRFLGERPNTGTKKNQYIINSCATRAQRILSSGMMAGITSPARPWFRLTTPDPRLSEVGSVKAWNHEVERIIRSTFERSNVYNALHLVYSDLATFGTAVMNVEEDLTEILRCHTFPVGQYCLANSPKMRVDTFFREFRMTVAQLVEMFSYEKCSDQVRKQYDDGEVDTWHDVVHLVEPNRKPQRGRLDYAGMAFSSCWYETSSGEDERMLREGGFEEFPAMCPRWMITAEDVYGSGPGMDALGDIKALQTLEKRKAEAVEKTVRPPMQAPMAQATRGTSILPGDTTFVDMVGAGQEFKPAMTIHPAAIPAVSASIQEHMQRVDAMFYADLWLALTQSGGNMTAREVAERHEEKMLQLGPVMERLQDELLDPLIDRAFSILLRNGYLPTPPPELQGQDLRVEYTSVMAQAQKLLGTSGVERLVSFVGNLAGAFPDIRDKLNSDQVVDEYATMLGVPPGLTRTDEEVAAIREKRTQQMAAQAQQEKALQAAQGAKLLSETDTGGDNALAQMMSGLGVGAPTGAGLKQ